MMTRDEFYGYPPGYSRRESELRVAKERIKRLETKIEKLEKIIKELGRKDAE